MTLLCLSLLLLLFMSMVVAVDVDVLCWSGRNENGTGRLDKKNCTKNKFCARLLITGSKKNMYGIEVPETWFIYGCGDFQHWNKPSELINVTRCNKTGIVNGNQVPKWNGNEAYGTLDCCEAKENKPPCNGYMECYKLKGTMVEPYKCNKTGSACYSFYDYGKITTEGCSEGNDDLCKTHDVTMGTCKDVKDIQGKPGQLCCCQNLSFCNAFHRHTTKAPQMTTPGNDANVVMSAKMVMTTMLVVIINKMG